MQSTWRNEIKIKIKMDVDLKMKMKKMRSQNPNYDEILLVTDTHQVVAHIQADNANEFFILIFSHVNHHLLWKFHIFNINNLFLMKTICSEFQYGTSAQNVFIL